MWWDSLLFHNAFLSGAPFSNITVFKPLNICLFFLKQFNNSTRTMSVWHLAIFCMFYRKYIFTNSPTFSFGFFGGVISGLFFWHYLCNIWTRISPKPFSGKQNSKFAKVPLLRFWKLVKSMHHFRNIYFLNYNIKIDMRLGRWLSSWESSLLYKEPEFGSQHSWQVTQTQR